MIKDNLLQRYFEEKEKNAIKYKSDIEEIIYLEMRNKSENMKTILPVVLGLKVTDRCNFRCPYCFVLEKNSKDMSLEMIKKIIEGFDGQKPYRIYLTGGEPFMNHQIEEIIQYIKSLNIALSIHTNASLLNEKNMEYIKRYFTYRDFLQISIDTAESKKFNSIRKNGNLDEIINNCISLSNNQIRFMVNMVITNKNVNDMKNVYILAEKIKAEQISFSPLMDMGNDDNIYLPNDEELLNSFNDVLEYYFSSNKKVIIKQDPLPVPWGNEKINKYICHSLLICPAGKTEVEIDMYGNVYVCPFLYKKEFCMGNINENSLVDIWNNEKFLLFSQKKWCNNKVCQSCNAFEVCNGGCIAYAINNSKDCDKRCDKQRLRK